MSNVNEIIDLIDSPSSQCVETIKKAYNFAENAHKGHKRYSGEPYFNHLFETAKILAELGKGPEAIAAGFLHDTIEDADVKEEEIEKEFGKEVLFLVQGVTKLGQLRYHGAERHTESLRKLFIAMSKDIRVLIIKLADRLHNMRTLQYVPKDKQNRIALETLEIYTPLAYRLGIRKISRELEDLSFKFVAREEYDKILKLRKDRNREKMKNLEKFQKSLMGEFGSAKMRKVRVESRVKNIYSLYKKLARRDNDIEKIYDIAALRVIVPTIEDCYKVLGIIHGHWRPLPGRIKDYIAFPRPNGYRSIHTTVFMGDGGIVEIQIRTEEMHKEAELGVASHFMYKNLQSRQEKVLDAISWFKKFIPAFKIPYLPKRKEGEYKETAKKLDIPEWVKQLGESQIENGESDKYIKDLRQDFFEFRVFTFTPKGDVVDLPIDSSPVDFAYAVHTELGDHVGGAKVNGKMVALETKLKNGDIVEIQKKKQTTPTSKWLKFVKTTLAKKRIRSHIDKETDKRETANTK